MFFFKKHTRAQACILDYLTLDVRAHTHTRQKIAKQEKYFTANKTLLVTFSSVPSNQSNPNKGSNMISNLCESWSQGNENRKKPEPSETVYPQNTKTPMDGYKV